MTYHPRDLAALLRDRSRWPDGFEWDFYDCRTCAMGLSQKTWKPEREKNPTVASTAALIGISVEKAHEIFAARPSVVWYNNGPRRLGVTPEDIAADLEALEA